jgi:pimeloyl-ACP methyl ester carboxylesterase
MTVVIRTMVSRTLTGLLLAAAFCLRAGAQDCPDVAPYADAREIIADLHRIVAPAGVQETYKAKIGGVDQWISVRGQDQANAIVLFVHGGPASPIIPRAWQFQHPMEEYFTFVNWDQRGTGKTYRETNPDSIADTIRIPRFVDDAIEVAEYVRKRYEKEKVLLMGHSWGTIVGMQAALKRPDLFYAYVGIGQVINVRENEKLSFEHGLKQAQANGNTEAVRELESIAPYPGSKPITRERINIARKWAQHYGGLTAYRDSSMYFYRAARLSSEYSAADVCAIDQGSLFTLGRVLPEFLEVDFTKVTTFPIPVILFMGRHDFTTPSGPTATWLGNVKAPYKQGIWFENSSHMIPWEEPGKMLVSLLEYVRPRTLPPRGN